MARGEYDNELTATPSAVADLCDQEVLANMGYKQELKRSFGLISMIGFTFSILTCWNALAGSLGEIFLNGGPATLVYGWIGCCAFSLAVVLILAELCSAYPVAGGQYSWCLILSKDTKWGRSISYICGWIQSMGIIGMVAVSWYQFSIDVNAMIKLMNATYIISKWRIALIAYAGGIGALLVNIFGIKILHYISNVSLWWSIGGFITCSVVVLACAPEFQSADFVFTEVVNVGWTNTGIAVIIGLMQPAFGMCTYDSVAHLAEETEDAAKQSPRAMVLAVIVGFLTGLGFILVLLFVIQDLESVLHTPTKLPLLEIFYQATNSKAGGICLTVISIVCQGFSMIALLTEGSRAVYAFARDGAFPRKVNHYLQDVSPELNVPVYSLLFTFGITAILVAMLFGSDTAFFTVLSISSTGLYISYLMPVVVYFFKPENKAPGYYNLGKWAIWLQIPSMVYLLFCSIFFFFPTTIPVDGNNMNYCIAAYGIMSMFALISWLLGAKNTWISEVNFIDGCDIIQNAELKKQDSMELERTNKQLYTVITQ